MAWRKWVVRSLVFTVLAGLAVAALAVQHFTNSAAVRQEVIAKLSEYLPGATVSLESARFALLGGITFNDLRLARRDDPGKTDFAVFPSGTIYLEKDQLLNGKLAIRKIEFRRPRLHVIRRPDGSWNLENILAAPDLRVPVPTIVLQQAAITMDDQQIHSALRPFEIKDVDLTIINDPHRPPQVSLLAYQGGGMTDGAGAICVNGSWGRKSGEFVLSLQLPSFAISGALVERLSAYCPEAALHARQLTGLGELRADFRYEPESARHWSYKVHGELKHGKLTHASLPFPLEDLEAKADYADGLVTLESITARSGATRLTLRDGTLIASDDPELEGTLEIEHLRMTDDLFAKLPKLQGIKEDYHPQGAISLTMEFRTQGSSWRKHCVIRPENSDAVYAKFPYPVERITGRIECDSDDFHPSKPDRLALKLVGYAGGQPVHLDGEIIGKGQAATIDLKVWGKDLPIDKKLRGALEPKFQKIVDSFSPSGKVDIEAYVRQAPGETKHRNQYLASFHDAAIRYELFPYPVENVTGTLDIRHDHWEFHDFHGTHQGGEFDSHGGYDPNTDKVTIVVTGTNVLLDEEMEAALVRQPGLQSAWKKLAPSGHMSFRADVEQLGQKEPEIAVTIRPLGCGMRPEFFAYALEDMRGLIVYRGGETVLEKLTARHGQTFFSLEKGKVYLKPDGDVSVDLVDLLGYPIVPDAELFRALPRPLGDICGQLQLKDPLSLRANMTIYVPADQSPPYIFWDGGLRLKDATLTAGVPMEHVSGTICCRGQHQGKFGNVLGNIMLDQAVIYNQPFQDIHSQIVVSEKHPDSLDLPNLKARIYGGEVGGPVHLEFAPSLRYEIDLTASKVKLEQFARRNNLGANAPLSGQAAARLFLQGRGTDRSGLEGHGTIDVPNGKMGRDLPLIIDLLKVLSFHKPDKTAFEEARIQFAIRGDQVEVGELNLYGNSISLSGQGTMRLDGSDIKLDFYAVWGRIVQISPPLIDKIWPLIGKQVLKIEMRGPFSKVECTRKPVPNLVEPVKKLLKRMSE